MNSVHITRYHPVLVILHWVLALLILAALALGALKMTHIPNSSPMKGEALRAHMAGGIVIAALMLLRLMTRTFSRRPVPATTGSARLDWLATFSHRAFYVLVLTMAVSGLVMAAQTGVLGILAGRNPAVPADFWVFPIRTVHYVFSRMLIVLIALHITAAVYHSVILRDGLLGRMGFGRRIALDRAPDQAIQVPGAEGAHRDEAKRVSRQLTSHARLVPWFSRLVLLLATIILTLIATKFILNPTAAATAAHMTLESPLAVTNMRASFGAFPLACAIVTLLCLVSVRRRTAGLGFIAILIGIVLVVRVFGILHDGTLVQSRTVLTAESVLLALSVLGLTAERFRSRREAAGEPLLSATAPAIASEYSRTPEEPRS